jgi:DNA-binding XRE family transcriptional regulator
VAACLATQLPEQTLSESPETDYAANLSTSLDLLKSWKFHVNRKRFHHKFVLIDKRIMYFGSMNVFSHFDTSECMRRTEDPEEIEEACEKFNLDHCEECMRKHHELWGNSDVDIPMKQFGLLLKKQRIRLSLSQLDLERLSGVPHQTIGAMERGRNCHIDAFLSVLKALGLSLAMVPPDTAPAILNITRNYWNEIPTLETPKQSTRSKKRTEQTSLIIAPSASTTTSTN